MPRAIPCLLLSGAGLVKTVRFRKPTYLGDPLNIARIFNDKEVDELILLDIQATPEGREPRLDMVASLASECFMPLCYGGGVRSLEQMRALYAAGVEKVAINTHAVEEPGFVRAAAEAFGSQGVVAAIDVARDWLGARRVVARGGRRRTRLDPVEHARHMQDMGAGEILLTSVERDGSMAGYDLDLVRDVTRAVSVPVVACGGAGCIADLGVVVRQAGAAAAAAGSLFVFSGPNRAVLINYPSPQQLHDVFDALDP
jgi:imidazole glycerol-phosphate synthase subunit HisF